MARALQPYFDGWYEADVEKLKMAFRESCRLTCVIDGKLDQDSMPKVYEFVANRQSPSSHGEKRHDRILSIHKSSPDIALAVVHLSIEAKLFTDYLLLVKLEGNWKIVSKLFSFSKLP
ncbi:nuclear transport factor 2 family protein [Azospirillum sp. Marseille-Q6669]